MRCRCPDRPVSRIGATRVTGEEVVAALTAAPPGRAPGADRILAEIYQRFLVKCATILAAAVSVAGIIGRPVTGLQGRNHLGRLSGRGPHGPSQLLAYSTPWHGLPHVCSGPSFSWSWVLRLAFLRHRCTPDNIMLLALAPRLLHYVGESGMIAFLDLSVTH